MRRLATVALVCLLVFALPALAGPDAAPAPTPALSPAPHSFLWQVTGCGPGTIDLLGSVHLLRPEGARLTPAMEKAFENADQVAFEVDIDDLMKAAPEMMALGKLPEGTTLQDVVSRETYTRLKHALASNGVPVKVVDGMKPWFAALTVTALELNKMGYVEEAGIDRQLWDRAKKDGKPTLALETPETQIAIFSELTEDQDAAFLRYSLDDLDSAEKLLDEFTEAWQAGDAARAETLLKKGFEAYPKLYTRIVLDRNQAWLTKLERWLAEPKTTLVVVGSLHMVGPEGLVAQLAAKGCTVEQR